MLSSLPCFYAFCWSVIPTSYYIFNVFYSYVLVHEIWNYFASCKRNGNFMLMFNARVSVGFGGLEVCFTNSGCCEAVSRQRVFSGYVCKRCFVFLDCGVRLKTEMEKAVFQVTVSLNIRKDSVAETLPSSRGNREGSSNKQLELPRWHPSSRQLVLDSRFGISECNPALHHKLT